MRCLIISKKQIKLFLAVALVLVTAVFGTIGVFAGNERRIPIYSVENNKKQIAISFDAAWGADDTDELIEILGEYKVKATFFVVGDWVDKYPEEVKKLSDAGHRVENHSNSHPYMTKISSEEKLKELNICNEKIKAITNRAPKLFRPPYGDYDNATIEAVESIGMYTIQWSVDSLDWQENATAGSIIQNCTNRTKEGDIILCHNDAEFTPDALPSILEKLQSDGFEFVLIEDLIYKENYIIDHTGRQLKGQ